jgi:hypothetical protein
MNKLTASPSYKCGGYWAAPRANADPLMCEKCVEIDDRIATYQRIASRITDQPTIVGTKRLIADLQAQKAALHSERKE